MIKIWNQQLPILILKYDGDLHLINLKIGGRRLI